MTVVQCYFFGGGGGESGEVRLHQSASVFTESPKSQGHMLNSGHENIRAMNLYTLYLLAGMFRHVRCLQCHLDPTSYLLSSA
jgi:hypothetical protein